MATNNHKTWSPRFRALFDKYRLGRFKNGNIRKDILDDPLNKVAVPGHKGPHSEPGFHQTIYDRLKNAADAGEANGGGIEGGRAALEKELETMRKEAVTPGTWLNDVLTKK
ncbi:TPA: AHH domain-containing protein [Escherichia coli]